ncbi:hypothetical protein AXZ95_3340 [Leifsonia sp. 115AMFTsu3.1]|nr:hypothetical protein AXZ95_3340 [Leifsonia sp. 115AMFTsu3.1]
MSKPHLTTPAKIGHRAHRVRRLVINVGSAPTPQKVRAALPDGGAYDNRSGGWVPNMSDSTGVPQPDHPPLTFDELQRAVFYVNIGAPIK